MKFNAMVPICFFLVAMATVVAIDFEPKFAALVFDHLNITLAPGAIETLQSHNLWTPSLAALNGLEPMFGDNFNGSLENEKFEESGLDINNVVHVGIANDNGKQTTGLDIAGDETGLANVDVCSPYPGCCDWCHKCEGGCASLIIFFIFPFLACLAACQSQDFCKGCD